MIVSFKGRGTEDVFNDIDSRVARSICPGSIWGVAQRKLYYLQSAGALKDLMSPPGNRLKKLSRDRAGQHSIRINDQYRICFFWTDRGAEQVEITDYH